MCPLPVAPKSRTLSRVCCALTFRDAAAVCDKLPLSPVIVRELLATGVELVVETVNVEVPDPLIESGAKLAVAPAGTPATLKATLPLKLFCEVTVME